MAKKIKPKCDEIISSNLEKKQKYELILLPDIELKINSRLSNLNLKPKTTVKEAIDHFNRVYKSVCVNSKGDKFFFKASMVNQNVNQVKEFLRELLFYKSLSHFKVNNDFPSYALSKYVGSGEEDFYWLLRECTEGEIMGNWFSFSKKFLNDTYLNILVDYADFVQFLHLQIYLSAVRFDFSELNKKDYYWLSEEIKNLKPILSDVVGENFFGLISREIENNKKLLNSTCHYLLHRDNHPENIIAVSQNQIALIDWTDISIGSYVYDFAGIWVHAWKNPHWQEKFLKKFIEKTNNKKEALLLFKLLLFYLLAVEIRNVNDVNLLKHDSVLNFMEERDIREFQHAVTSAHSKSLISVCCDFFNFR